MNFGGALSVFTQIPIDWLIIIIFVLVVTIDAMRAGSVRAASLAISFPISAYLFQLIPQTIALSTISNQFKGGWEQAILFLIIEALLFVCMHQLLTSFDPYTSLLSSLVSAIAAAAVLLVVWTSVPALQALWHFDPQIQAIFGASYRFLWLMAAFLALAFIGS